MCLGFGDFGFGVLECVCGYGFYQGVVSSFYRVVKGFRVLRSYDH